MVVRMAAAILGALTLAGPAGAAAGGCHAVSGTFSALPAPCPPGFDVCTLGTLAGDLEGTYAFQGAFGGPGLVGESTITLTNGAVIEGSDTTTFTGPVSFVTTVSFVGGTRQFAHATGSLAATGVLDPVTFGTSGTYEGEYCLGVAKGRP